VKQQENEREEKAIQALTRALSLEPSHLPAWLALSISYTNENDREAAYDSLQRWVDENKKYEGVIARYKLESAGTVALGERHQVLIDSLLAMVRNSPDGEVDADVQIALAVLLNINEVDLLFCGMY
jgi:peroxin-5